MPVFCGILNSRWTFDLTLRTTDTRQDRKTVPVILLVKSKRWTLLRLSNRIRFSILTTVLTFAYTFYLYLSTNLLGHYWYIITAPLATFVCSYSFGIILIKGRWWLIYILPLSAALTLISHCLNLLLLCIYLALTNFFSSPSNMRGYHDNVAISFILEMVFGSIVIIIYGTIISLYKGGLVSFIIFVLSGTLTMLMPSKFKKENLPEETLPRDDKNNWSINNTNGNSN